MVYHMVIYTNFSLLSREFACSASPPYWQLPTPTSDCTRISPIWSSDIGRYLMDLYHLCEYLAAAVTHSRQMGRNHGRNKLRQQAAWATPTSDDTLPLGRSWRTAPRRV